MKKPPQIGILGCGWLGKAVAKVLIEKGYIVKGSVTSKEGFEALKTFGIKPFKVNLNADYPVPNIDDFIADLSVLAIAVPPKIREGKNEILAGLSLMFKNPIFSNLDKIIFISSTGVFQDGEQVKYDEASPPNNTSERGKHLAALEKLILEQKQPKQNIILRYGGLIKNGGRHPIHYLQGKKGIANPDGPVNLIEQTDAVNLLCKIIESDCHLKIYHGVYPSHPSREVYYTQKAKELNLEPPVFEKQKISLGKIVLSEKTLADLNLSFESSI